MLDLKRIREDPDGVRAALARRGPALLGAVDEVLERDLQWRAATTSAENLRATQKMRSEEFAAAKARGEDAPELRAAMQEMSAQVKEFTEQANRAKQELDALLAPLPNLPDPTAAPGPGDELVREVGAVRQLDFPPRDHLELAGEMIDMDRAARLSGARFAYLKGDLVMLELALVRWVLEKLRGAGFEPVVPPVLVRERALYGTGFLPDTEQQIYTLPEDELFLVGTSEVALASLHDSEILDRERLPLRYAGFSPCFRREAGAAGKDTRGIFRVHQFDKVEMFSFVTPEESAAGARADPRARGGDPRRARAALPGRQHRRRRPRQLGGQEVRLRGVDPEPGPLPRVDIVLEHHRLPGAAIEHSRPRRWPHASAAHAQRDRRRGRAHDRCAARERPARRRQRRAAAGAARLRRAGELAAGAVI